MVQNIQNQLKPVKSKPQVTVVQPVSSNTMEEKPKEIEEPKRQFGGPSLQVKPAKEEPKKQDEQKPKPTSQATTGKRQPINKPSE
jgi:hypothetical protein